MKATCVQVCPFTFIIDAYTLCVSFLEGEKVSVAGLPWKVIRDSHFYYVITYNNIYMELAENPIKSRHKV